MPGVIGQVQLNPRKNTKREKAWQVIRQRGAQGFTLVDLLVALEVSGDKDSNFKKMIKSLSNHGYIQKRGVLRVANGKRTLYAIVRETRSYPTICATCGKPMITRNCRVDS